MLLDKGVMTPHELSTALNLGQRKTQRYLKKLAERGLVEKIGFGKYQVKVTPELLERAKKITKLT